MRVSVIGTGRVGATVAFALVAKGLVDELVLANRTEARAEGEAKDLIHASAFVERSMSIRWGWLDATAGSDILVVCASAAATHAVRTRVDLAQANSALFRDLIPKLAERSPSALLIVVTNPVDVLTYAALQLSDFDSSRVLGTGTLVDSARYRTLLSRELGIHSDDIRAYILGEHGDSQFPANSVAWCGGERLADGAQTRSVFEQAVRTGYDVYHAKGYTNDAIALAVALVVESISNDSRRTMPLCVALEGYLGEHGVCLSIPVVVGRAGIVRRLHPELSPSERAAFADSADAVRRVMRETGW